MWTLQPDRQPMYNNSLSCVTDKAFICDMLGYIQHKTMLLSNVHHDICNCQSIHKPHMLTSKDYKAAYVQSRFLLTELKE